MCSKTIMLINNVPQVLYWHSILWRVGELQTLCTDRHINPAFSCIPAREQESNTADHPITTNSCNITTETMHSSAFRSVYKTLCDGLWFYCFGQWRKSSSKKFKSVRGEKIIYSKLNSLPHLVSFSLVTFDMV